MLLSRQEVEQALRQARMDCLIHGHEWDVADAMAALEQIGLIPNR